MVERVVATPVAAELIEFAAAHSGLKKILERSNIVRINLPDADHTFSDRKARGEVEAATLAWLERIRLGNHT